MQNSKKFIIIGALLLLAGGSYYFSQSTNSDFKLDSHSESNSDSFKVVNPLTKKVETNTLPHKFEENEIKASSEKLSTFSNFTVNEKKSLIVVSSFLNDAGKGDLPMNSFVEDLKKLNLRPVIMKDENEYTGGLNIVRTSEALPGTRYIHAQYFDGENATSLLQHLSFEFRGGENAFEMVKKVIKEQLNITTPPIQESDSYISWRIGKRIVWIKKLDLADISKANPFNSYDLKTDVGTIRVAIELEIH